MAAGKYNFTIEQGATVDFEIAYKDSNSLPVDLTGHQARMQFRSTPGAGDLLLTLTSSLGACGTGLNLSGSDGLNPPTSGTIGVFISAASSSNLSFTRAYYDLEIASGSGNCAVVTRVIEGSVNLSKNVTLGSFE